MVTSIVLVAALKFFARRGWPAIVLLLASPSFGGIISTGTSVVFSGTAGNGLSARATFTVDPANSDVLRLLLENTSPSPTTAPWGLLASVYFNVLTGTVTGSAAPLTYQSASGQVYLALRSSPDKPATYVPPPPPGGTVTYPLVPAASNLQAFNPGDDTWQFRTGLSLVASQPPLAFGLGTVGNNFLSPNNFNGNIVNGKNFGIYVGEVTTANLNNELLVNGSATFTFAGFQGFTLAQVSPHVVFGFGTDPGGNKDDVIVSVPEPGTLSLAAFGLIGALLSAWRRHLPP